jgi:hypothetical protein
MWDMIGHLKRLGLFLAKIGDEFLAVCRPLPTGDIGGLNARA